MLGARTRALGVHRKVYIVSIPRSFIVKHEHPAKQTRLFSSRLAFVVTSSSLTTGAGKIEDRIFSIRGPTSPYVMNVFAA